MGAWWRLFMYSMSRLSSLPYFVVRRASSRARPYLRTLSAVRETMTVLRLICVRLPTSSFVSTRVTCAFTVATLMWSSAAISALVRPWPTATANATG